VILRRLAARHALEAVLLLTCAVLAAVAPEFLTRANLWNVLRSVAEIGIIACGMTLVIVAGEIDLSVGSQVAFAGCLIALLVQSGLGTVPAVAIALLSGALIGAAIGAVRAMLNVPTFITSLAGLTILRGGALKLTGGFPLTPFPEGYAFLGSGRLAGIPLAVLVFGGVAVAVHVLKDHTAFGRAVHAIGANAEAARLSALPIVRVRILALALTGALAALSGVLLSSRLLSGNPTVAAGWELDVIAAVIVGGTSLSGGQGSVRGTILGVLFVGVLVNGMRLLDVQEDAQLVARGALVLLAVLWTRLQPDDRRA
jgi:ribose/xylose/arabinose/galactoside ABC-type transport system permease subunit